MRYAYVICEWVDGLPSFRHEFVEASSDEEAYAAGHKTVRQPTGEGLNDYVFPCEADSVGKPEYEWWGKCRSPFSVFNPPELESTFYCGREKDHKGLHIAYGPNKEELVKWSIK